MGSGGTIPRVIVVGAGISGVAAAATLQKLGGVEVILLEANHRVGGRIFSNEFGDEKVEMGANWIHGTNGSPIMEIAEQHDLLNLSSGPWGGTRWTGANKYRREGGAEVDPELVGEVKGLFKKLVTEAQLIGARGGKADTASSAAVEQESVATHLKRGLEEYLSRGKGEGHGTGASTPAMESFEEERWEDDWAGAEVLAEPGTSAVAYQDTVSASAGATAGTLEGQTNKLERPDIDKPREGAVEVPPGPCAGWSEEDVRLRAEVFAMRERLECCISGVDALDQLSLRWFGEYEEYPGPHVTIAKGYSRVVEILADQLLPGTLKFGQEVTQICWSSEPSLYQGFPVEVATADGSKFGAQHVIVTVSLGVLKERAGGGPTTPQQNLFLPALPEWKLAAIRRMGFGTVDKVFLQFPKLGVWGDQCLGLEMLWADGKDASSAEPPPASNSKSAEGKMLAGAFPNWARKLFAFHPINVRSNVVVAWIAGREAQEMETVPEADVMQTCADVIAHFLPEEDRSKLSNPTAVLRTRWGSDPLFRGSYSYVALGSSGDDIDTLARPLPGSDVGPTVDRLPAGQQVAPLQVLFAGEATHRHSYSNTHGAFHAGLREAKRILDFYGLRVSP